MYSLYVLAVLHKSSQWCADFYEELLDEVKDRVARGIAAVPNERCRVMSDTQPPWAFLKIFRYLEDFGAVSIGSLYTFGLEGTWEDTRGRQLDAAHPAMEEGHRDQRPRPRRCACTPTGTCRSRCGSTSSIPRLKTEMMKYIVKHWGVDGVMIHMNRGCEGLSMGIMENRLAASPPPAFR